MVLRALLKYMGDIKEDMEKRGLIPTLELAITELQDKLAEELEEKNNLN